ISLSQVVSSLEPRRRRLGTTVPSWVLTSDYAIWLVALLFYIFDSARLLHPQELLILEARRGRLTTAFTDIPFTLVGRPLYFCPLLFPHRAAFLTTWGKTWLDHAEVARELDSLRRRLETLRPIRIFALEMAVMLFAVGPGLTLLRGAGIAVVYTAAVVYVIAVASGVVLWQCRRDLDVRDRDALRIAIEMILCPAFVPNLVRRITM